MSGWDVAIIFAFLGYSVYAGLKSRGKASTNLEEYFLAGRSLPGWKAGISMAATQFAADTPLLVTGMTATAGLFALWQLWIFGISFLLLGFVLAPSWRRARVLTDAELTELRYRSRAAPWLRAVKAIYFGTIFNCMVLAWVLLATTRIAEPFLTWNLWLPAPVFHPFVWLVHAVGTPLTVAGPNPASWSAQVWIHSANNLISILAIVSVTTFYSTTGGLRCVVDTDVVQFAMMMGATLMFSWLVVHKCGGLAAIPHKLHQRFDGGGGPDGITASQILAFTPSVAKDATFGLLLLLSVQWLAQMNSDGTGYLAQRVMACKSDREAKKAMVLFTGVQILLRSLLWIPLTLGLLLLFPPNPALHGVTLIAERESTYVRGIAELLPVGAMGIMLTAMLAALASTLDTHLNWGASYWTNDLYRRFLCRAWRKREPNPRTLVWVARGSNICILLLALAVMTQLGSITTAWKTALLLGAGMGGALLMRWLWWRLNAWGELSATLVSLVLSYPLVAGIRSLRAIKSWTLAGGPVLADGPKDGGWVSVFGLFRFSSTSPGVSAEAWRLLVMFVVATGVAIAVSLILGPEPKDQLEAFYRRARPPGFWGPIATAAGGDPRADARRLGRGLIGVATSSLSIFSLLTGLGSLLAGSPPPTWFPRRGAWLALLIGGGAALIPIWWRIAFSRRSPHALPPEHDSDNKTEATTQRKQRSDEDDD